MYRGIAKPTDVLSFPAEEKPRRGTYLGDIVISVDTAMDQILEFGHSLDEEIRVLALHGLLHLMGYDHENDNGRMRAVEERLRKQLGLDAGVISRATRRKSGIGAQQIRQIIRRASFRQMRRRYASETRDRLKPVLHRSSRTR
jgi:rRNA maturation RNase YbeY